MPAVSALTALLNLNIPNKNLEKDPDPQTKEEIDDLFRQEVLEQTKIETALKKHELNQKKAEHDQRVGYARRIFFLISIWLLVILLIVVASGSKCAYFTLELSDQVLITLLTTTTITVLGLFITVLKYIFGRK